METVYFGSLYAGRFVGGGDADEVKVAEKGISESLCLKHQHATWLLSTGVKVCFGALVHEARVDGICMDVYVVTTSVKGSVEYIAIICCRCSLN